MSLVVSQNLDMLTLGESRGRECSSDRQKSKLVKKRRYGKRQKRKIAKIAEAKNAAKKMKKVQDSSDSENNVDEKVG